MIGRQDIMKDMIGGIVLVIMGLYFAVFHNRISQRAVRFCDQLRIAHISESAYRTGFLVVGIAFVAFGTLQLLGVV